MAGYFYDVFFQKGLTEYFDTVVFAILHDEGKLNAFAEVFGGKITQVSRREVP